MPGTTESLVYDVVGSPSALWNPSTGSCVETDGSDLSAGHSTDPAVGQVTYFLVRAENRCGDGDVGEGLDGGTPIPRNVQVCE